MVENKNIVRIFLDITLSLFLSYNVYRQHVNPVSSLKQVIKLRNTNICGKFFTIYTYAVLEKSI